MVSNGGKVKEEAKIRNILQFSEPVIKISHLTVVLIDFNLFSTLVCSSKFDLELCLKGFAEHLILIMLLQQLHIRNACVCLN